MLSFGGSKFFLFRVDLFSEGIVLEWNIKSQNRLLYKMAENSLGVSSPFKNYIKKTRLFKYIENFTSKDWKFLTDIFHTFAQNIDCEYPQSMFSSKIRKNKQIPWGIYVPRLIFIWGVKNGLVIQRTIGSVSPT